MLACAGLGAPHTVIFAETLSADSIADRANDGASTFAITADGGWRRGSKIPLKETMDQALEKCPTIRPNLRCVNRTDDAKAVSMKSGRDISGGTAPWTESGERSEHDSSILFASCTHRAPG